MDKGSEFDIPKPCSEKFASMTGDDRARHCAKCNKMVHNLSAMSSDEARDLLRGRGKVCVTCKVNGLGEVITTDYEEMQEKRLMVAQCALAICLMLGVYGFAKPIIGSLVPKAIPDQSIGIAGGAVAITESTGKTKARQESYSVVGGEATE